MAEIIVAVQAIVFFGDQILAVERKSGLLGFPGGKVEKDESPIVACLRELREETGIKGFYSAYKLIHAEEDYQGKRQRAFIFPIWPGELIPEEGRKAMFMGVKEFIEKSEFPDYNIRVLQKIGLWQ